MDFNVDEMDVDKILAGDEEWSLGFDEAHASLDFGGPLGMDLDQVPDSNEFVLHFDPSVDLGSLDTDINLASPSFQAFEMPPIQTKQASPLHASTDFGSELFSFGAAASANDSANGHSNGTSPGSPDEQCDSRSYTPSLTSSSEGDDLLQVPKAGKDELESRPFAKRPRKGKAVSSVDDLSPEEVKLLRREGFVLPEGRDLTADEHKLLKRLRRKVKNKISAQDSRKRRKEYVTQLESQVKNDAGSISMLKTKVTSLEKSNQSLLEQLKEAQIQLSKYVKTHGASAGTALMLLGLCFSMFVSPEALNTTGSSFTSSSPSFHSRTLKSIPAADYSAYASLGQQMLRKRDEDDIALSSQERQALDDIHNLLQSASMDEGLSHSNLETFLLERNSSENPQKRVALMPCVGPAGVPYSQQQYASPQIAA